MGEKPFNSLWSVLKNDQRGLDNVVVATLLLLVSLICALFFWDLVSIFLEEMWGTIVEESVEIVEIT